MAGEPKIRSGTKLRMALDVPIGEEPKFNLICTFVKSLDVASFLISIPMLDGKPMALDERRKLLIRYGSDKDGMIVAGYADDIVKDGIRRCWKIRRVAEQRQFFQRADERLKVTIPITYSQPTWHPDSEGVIRPEDGLTLDISLNPFALELQYKIWKEKHLSETRNSSLCMLRIMKPGKAMMRPLLMAGLM